MLMMLVAVLDFGFCVGFGKGQPHHLGKARSADANDTGEFPVVLEKQGRC